SSDRQALLQHIPATIRFKPMEVPPHPDHDLTRQVRASIEAAHPAPGTPAADFLRLLTSGDPIGELRGRVEAYRDRVRNRFADETSRREEAARLLRLAVERRRRVLQDPVLSELDETKSTDHTSSLLFPLPPP